MRSSALYLLLGTGLMLCMEQVYAQPAQQDGKQDQKDKPQDRPARKPGAPPPAKKPNPTPGAKPDQGTKPTQTAPSTSTRRQSWRPSAELPTSHTHPTAVARLGTAEELETEWRLARAA